MTISNYFKHLQNTPPHSCLAWLQEAWNNHRKPCGWTDRLSVIIWEGLFHSVIMLQLSDPSLVAVDFTLQAFNLLFVVVNFFLVMLLQCSQLLLLFASKV